MIRTFLAVVCVLLGAACTTIKVDHGGENEIVHEPGTGKAQELADRACRLAGSGRGEIISTVNKDPSLPDGTGRQVTTFRCTTHQP